MDIKSVNGVTIKTGSGFQQNPAAEKLPSSETARQDAVEINQANAGRSQDAHSSAGMSQEEAYAWSENMQTTMKGLEALFNAAASQSGTVQEGQTGEELDWNPLMNWFPASNQGLSSSIRELTDQVQQLWKLIEQNYSGAERTELLTKLENLFNEKLDLLYNTFQPLTDFLSQNGQSSILDLFLPSIKQEAGEKLQQETKGSLPAQEKARKGQEGASRSAVSNASAEAKGKAAATEGRAHAYTRIASYGSARSPALFTIREIDQANQFVKENQDVLLDKGLLGKGFLSNQEGKGEAWGLDLGLLSLKTEVFVKNAHITSKLGETLQAAVKTVLNHYRNQAEQPRRLAQPAGFQDTQKPEYPEGQDYRIALLVNEKIAEEYQRSRNVTKAVAAGMKCAKAAYEELAQKQTEPKRMAKAASFWEMLYLMKDRPEPEQKQLLQRLKLDWNDFVRSMELKGGETAGLYLNLYHSGIAELFHSRTSGQPRGGRAQPISGILSFSWMGLSIVLILLRLIGVPIPTVVLAVNLCAASLAAVLIRRKPGNSD